MPMNYDKLFAKMKEAGLTSYKIRQQKIMSEGTLTHLRQGKPVSTEVLCKLCGLLSCQPGDIMAFVPEMPEEKPEA